MTERTYDEYAAELRGALAAPGGMDELVALAEAAAASELADRKAARRGRNRPARNSLWVNFDRVRAALPAPSYRMLVAPVPLVDASDPARRGFEWQDMANAIHLAAADLAATDTVTAANLFALADTIASGATTYEPTT